MIRQILRDGRESNNAGVTSGDAAAGARRPLSAVDQPPIPWLDPPPGPWTVERAYAYCEEFARAHTESFPVASRFVPVEIRPHLITLYAFARSADDFADEPQYEGRRVEALDRWEEELRRCYHGEATHPVFIALADTIERRDLSFPPLEDMLTAFRMDLDVRRYATFSSLRGYTARSAEPVGRLLLALFGYRAP
jgi:phytoene/squalene synthetase